ncbi:MAG: hypothetical protein HYX53_08790 [Chloroflexi bacterium]|nr:hypothetical protein [Chloroflexota bacterium]
MRKIAIALMFLGASIGGAAIIGTGFAEPSQLPTRAVVPFVSNDAATPAPTPTPATFPPPPPPGPNYCGGGPSLGPPSPPNAIFGLFTIGGEPAPAGTLVWLTFDGELGPAIYTREPGGYKFNYAAGGQGHEPPCANVVGSIMGFLVDGKAVSTGVRVGDPEAYLAFYFDLNVP